MLSKEFEPLTITYAVVSGEAVEDKPNTYSFTYELFAMNTGFVEALAGVTAPIKALTAQPGIPPTVPTQVYHHEDKHLVGIDLHHPSYRPFGCDVPLVIIRTQLLDEELIQSFSNEVTADDTTGDDAAHTGIGTASEPVGSESADRKAAEPIPAI